MQGETIDRNLPIGTTALPVTAWLRTGWRVLPLHQHGWKMHQLISAGKP